MNAKLLKWIVLGVALLLMVFVFTQSCTSVKSTERGVSVLFGKVQEDKDIYAGLNFKLPFVERIHKYSIEMEEYVRTRLRLL